MNAMNSTRPNRSIGEMEAEFTNQIVKFEKEYMGRGPIEARSFLIGDMMLVRLKGVLTPAEDKLIQNSEGRVLVKSARRQLFDTSRTLLGKIVEDILGAKLIDLFSDISLESGERVIIFILDRKINP